MEKHTIEINNLTLKRGFSFDTAPLSISLHSGDLLLLKGANGSGKTSLLRCLSGLLPPHSGTYSIEIKNTHWIGDKTTFQEDLSVKDNLKHHCLLDGFQYSRDALDYFDVKEFENTKIKYLSLGQKKRVQLSVLLMQYKPIWLLDEPSSGLDEAHKKKLLMCIKTHRMNAGISIIASHSTDFWGASHVIEFDKDM